MRYELTDHEWAAVKPMLPNKPRGVARVNDCRVLNGIFWCCGPGRLADALPSPLRSEVCYEDLMAGQCSADFGRLAQVLG
jgi:transposase